jgi:Flp pilus assembly protein TadD
MLALTSTLRAVETPVERAAALLDKGEFLAAERLIEPLAQAKRPDAVVLWEMSRVRAGQHLGDEAIKFAERAIKLDPKQARFHAQLGAALLERMNDAGRLDRNSYAERMARAFEKALQLDPNNVTALTGLSRYNWLPPDADKAALARAWDLAQRARKVDAFLGEMELGSVAARRNDFKTALEHYEAAAELRPNDANAQTSCGLALLRLHREREARERFENAIKISPSADMARESLQALDAKK